MDNEQDYKYALFWGFKMIKFTNWNQLLEALYELKFNEIENLINELEESNEFTRGYRKGCIDTYNELVRDIGHKLKHGLLESVESID